MIAVALIAGAVGGFVLGYCGGWYDRGGRTAEEERRAAYVKGYAEGARRSR